MEEEILDIVNEQDEVIGSQPRSGTYPISPKNFRVVNAFIINSAGQLWIPRRTSTKSIFPNALDFSIGGHVQHGDSYDETIVKECMEEVNIDLNTTPFKLLGKLTPKQHGVSSFMQIYQIDQDNSPNYNPDDFTEFFWLSPQELTDRIKSGELVKGDLEIVVNNFYL